MTMRKVATTLPVEDTPDWWEAVGEADVLEVVAKSTGIPVQRLQAADGTKLLQLEVITLK